MSSWTNYRVAQWFDTYQRVTAALAARDDAGDLRARSLHVAVIDELAAHAATYAWGRVVVRCAARTDHGYHPVNASCDLCGEARAEYPRHRRLVVAVGAYLSGNPSIDVLDELHLAYEAAKSL